MSNKTEQSQGKAVTLTVNRNIVIAAVTVVAVIVVIIGIIIGINTSKSRGNSYSLGKVASACKISDDDTSSYLEVGDNGKSLTLRVGNNVSSDADDLNNLDDGGMKALDCIAAETKMPDATQSKIDQTTGLSGTQTDTWGNMKATWTYNADNGLDIVFEMH